MEKIILEMPTLYGDHQVLKVREALSELKGIDEVYVSSAWKQLMVSFDSKKLKQSDLEKAIEEAGFHVGKGELPVLVKASDIKRDPQWYALGFRVTETNTADVVMSGEFRRY